LLGGLDHNASTYVVNLGQKCNLTIAFFKIVMNLARLLSVFLQYVLHVFGLKLGSLGYDNKNKIYTFEL